MNITSGTVNFNCLHGEARGIAEVLAAGEQDYSEVSPDPDAIQAAPSQATDIIKALAEVASTVASSEETREQAVAYLQKFALAGLRSTPATKF